MSLADAYARVRRATEALVEHLEPEDLVVQSMPEASPAKWHLAHTTWFFETFVLGGPPHDDRYPFLFNSYYEALGPRIARPSRGMLTRPTLREVIAWRHAVDAHVLSLLESEEPAALQLGLSHEEQHQELLLTDLLHAFSRNPLKPPYLDRDALRDGPPAAPLRWHAYPPAVHWMGADGNAFSFDNERPRHAALTPGFELSSRLVTCAEYLGFIEDGGYERPELWLSEGWDWAKREAWRAPLYWELRDGVWFAFSLRGSTPIDPDAPVCHVSHFEADAFARWAGARLPTEAEWERAAESAPIDGNFVETRRLVPAAAVDGAGVAQLFGDVWEWTASAYLPYPGFTPEAGAAGEYNGKFMTGQMVLRGGSCLTPEGHVRATYRNFFPPQARWQMSGLRLAR